LNPVKQTTWLLAAILSLSFSGWYFSGTTKKPRLDEKTLSTTADMIIYNLTVQQFDAGGQLINALETPLMHHIPSKNTHWLKNPHVSITQQNEPAWEIQAQQATAIYGGQQITFNKQVVIHQAKNESTQESTLKTESLTYFPKKKFATTSLAVIYERPGSIVQSTGMKVYLAEKRVVLLSQARGTYVPTEG
jgi:lipopolysaccharide export system protein LptC